MKEATASQIRESEYAEGRMGLLLSVHPQEQAMAIARHYVENAKLAVSLLRLLQDIQLAGSEYVHAREAAEFMLRELKRNHARDLGIRLEWPA